MTTAEFLVAWFSNEANDAGDNYIRIDSSAVLLDGYWDLRKLADALDRRDSRSVGWKSSRLGP